MNDTETVDAGNEAVNTLTAMGYDPVEQATITQLAADKHRGDLAKAIAEYDRLKRMPHYQKLYFATPKDRSLGEGKVEIHITAKTKRGVAAFRYAPEGANRLPRVKGDTQPGQPYSKLITVPSHQDA